MPIELRVVGDTAEEFAKKLAGVVSLSFGRVANAVAAREDAPPPLPPAPIEPAPDAEPPKAAKRGRPAKAKTGGDMPSEKQDEIDRDLTPAASQADVKEALLALLSAKGDDAPPALLKEFGVAKISELKAEQYASVIATAKEAAK